MSEEQSSPAPAEEAAQAPVDEASGAFTFSEEREARFQEIVRRYPTAESAIMPTLWLCQDEWGWLRPGMPEWVAHRLGVSLTRVYELITFYTMYYTEDPGRHNLQVCRNVSCHLMGAPRLVDHLRKRLGIEVGQTSPDGRWRLEVVECLGACGYGPMMQVGKRYYEHLTPEKVDALIEEWSKSE